MVLNTRTLALTAVLVSTVCPRVLQAQEKPVSMEAIMEEISTLKALVEAQQKKIDELSLRIQPTAVEPTATPVNLAAPTAPVAQAAADTSALQFKIGDATITPVGFMD